MVCEWSPEPTRDIEDGMSAPSQVLALNSDESEDETIWNAPPGYELLPPGPPMDVSSDEEEETQAAGEMQIAEDVNSSLESDVPSISADVQVSQRHSDIEETDCLYSSAALRPQMTVDCDEVRAAMAGFTLPSSSYPVWATDVPESQWSATLAQRIQQIQANTSNTKH